MRNILDEPYSYDLFHLTKIAEIYGAYRAVLDRLVKAEAELRKAYPDNTDILDEYQSADIKLHNLSNRKVFKVGTQLVLEIIKPSSEVRDMRRYKSEQIAYNPRKKKYVPLWRLDTLTVTVTIFNDDNLTKENKTYNTDSIGYNLHFSDSQCPDKLRGLVNQVRALS